MRAVGVTSLQERKRVNEVMRAINQLRLTSASTIAKIQDELLGVETEFIVGRWIRSSGGLRFQWTRAYNVPMLERGGLSERLGTDGASHTGEWRMLPPQTISQWLELSPYKMVVEDFARLWLALKLRGRREVVHCIPNKHRVPCGTHIHVPYSLARKTIGSESCYDILDVFKPLIRLTKERFGDRSAFSCYGGLDDHRHQGGRVEIRGFETCFYQSPSTILTTIYNVLEILIAKAENREPELLEYPELDSLSQARNFKVRFQDITEAPRWSPISIGTMGDNDIIKTSRIALVRARDYPDGFVIASKILNQHGFHQEATPEELQDHNARIYLILHLDAKEVIGTIGFRLRTGEISHLCIKPQWRRQGFAREAINAIMTAYFKKYSAVRFNARIRKDNTPSQRLFESIGFERAEEGKTVYYYTINVSRERRWRVRTPFLSHDIILSEEEVR